MTWSRWPGGANSGDDSPLIPVVNSRGKWGYINSRGRVVIPFRWEEARLFHDDGLAWVQTVDAPNLWGAIDREGNYAG